MSLEVRMCAPCQLVHEKETLKHIPSAPYCLQTIKENCSAKKQTLSCPVCQLYPVEKSFSILPRVAACLVIISFVFYKVLVENKI